MGVVVDLAMCKMLMESNQLERNEILAITIYAHKIKVSWLAMFCVVINYSYLVGYS